MRLHTTRNLLLMIPIFFLGINKSNAQISKITEQDITRNYTQLNSKVISNQESLFQVLPNTNITENSNFLFSNEENFIKFDREETQITLDYFTNSDEHSWKKNISYSGVTAEIEFSNDGNRIIIYGYTHGDKFIESIIDSNGNELNLDNIPRLLTMSSSGKFFYTENGLSIYNQDLEPISLDFIHEIISFDPQSDYRMHLALLDGDILRLAVTKFGILDESSTRKTNKNKKVPVSNEIFLIDMLSKELLTNIRTYEKDVFRKNIYDLTASRTKVLYSFKDEDPVSQKNVGEMKLNLLDLSTNQNITVATGPYLYINKSNSNDIYFAQRDKSRNVTLNIIDENNEILPVKMSQYKRVLNLKRGNEELVVQTKFLNDPYLKKIETITDSGSFENGIVGWFNKNLKGIVPITETSFYIKSDN